MKTLGRYIITYDNGISQHKNLIKHEDLLNDINPALERIEHLKLMKQHGKANEIKKYLQSNYGDDYFTDKSGLGIALKTGILALPAHMGGNSNVIFTKIL